MQQTIFQRKYCQALRKPGKVNKMLHKPLKRIRLTFTNTQISKIKKIKYGPNQKNALYKIGMWPGGRPVGLGPGSSLVFILGKFCSFTTVT